MNMSISLARRNSSFSVVASVLLVLSMIFLQEGFSYYVSFQCLSLIVMGAVTLHALRDLKCTVYFSMAYAVFVFFLFVTSQVSPMLISQNSSNMLVTVIGVCIYALMIGCQPYMRFVRIGLVLNVLKNVSAATILLLTGLMLLSESNVLPFLNRTAMLEQNSRLIDNFTDPEAIATHQAMQLLLGTSDRIDLFYGEPSFLAIVLFCCLGCLLLTSRLLEYALDSAADSRWRTNWKRTEFTILLGVLSLMYVQSFSSILYALVVIYFAFIKGRFTRGRLVASLPFMLTLSAAFAVFSYDYFVFRLTQGDSLSFEQRFGFLWETNLIELLTVSMDTSILPNVGIHNGLFYILAIAGFGGVLYVASLLYSAFILAARLRLSMLAFMLVLAVMMQNGGVFSPSKVMLFALVLLPLACLRSLGVAHIAPVSPDPIHA